MMNDKKIKPVKIKAAINKLPYSKFAIDIEGMSDNINIPKGTILRLVDENKYKDKSSLWIGIDIDGLNIGKVKQDISNNIKDLNEEYKIIKVGDNIYEIMSSMDAYLEMYSQIMDITKIYLNDSNVDNLSIIASEEFNQYENISGDKEGILYEDSLEQLLKANRIIDKGSFNILCQDGEYYAVPNLIDTLTSDQESLYLDFTNRIKLKGLEL